MTSEIFLKCVLQRDRLRCAASGAGIIQQGFYHEAVGKCRLALEPFFEKVEKDFSGGEKRLVPVLKPSWEDRLGKATYTWLNEAFLALKKPMNEPHHLSSSPQFDQLDAQMLRGAAGKIFPFVNN